MVINLSPKLSILISVYGQADKLKRCLSSLQNTLPSTLSYEVLIIDDASEDHTTDFIKSYEPTYRVFFNEKRSGFAKNNNFCTERAIYSRVKFRKDRSNSPSKVERFVIADPALLSRAATARADFGATFYGKMN